MRDEINAFCTRIGADRLLVQGAGGNVSWKNASGELWIKASGTWLRDALRRDIFVPVALEPLRAALSQGHFDVKPQTLGEGSLKPSIETVLHALLPQPVVVHVHAVEALALLVRVNGIREIDDRMAGFAWRHVHVPYFKPGADLARAVAEALAREPTARVVFLSNHGIVLASDTVAAAAAMLSDLSGRLANPMYEVEASAAQVAPQDIDLVQGGRLHRVEADEALHELGTRSEVFRRVKSDWALCPDHVVFLGARANAHADVENARQNASAEGVHIVAGAGVYAAAPLNEAIAAQLLCFRDLIVRQPANQRLRQLDHDDVAALLNWDAEAYRRQMSKLA
jgi:rhamnose utilization protein RhaD (predicted bifunctional aldolase and dehydrogenase)